MRELPILMCTFARWKLIDGKHPKIAVLPLHKKPLYDWLHIRVLCYL